jgi:hypothetical protein
VLGLPQPNPHFKHQAHIKWDYTGIRCFCILHRHKDWEDKWPVNVTTNNSRAYIWSPCVIFLFYVKWSERYCPCRASGEVECKRSSQTQNTRLSLCSVFSYSLVCNGRFHWLQQSVYPADISTFLKSCNVVAVSWLRRLVSSLSPRRPRFYTRREDKVPLDRFISYCFALLLFVLLYYWSIIYSFINYRHITNTAIDSVLNYT